MSMQYDGNAIGIITGMGHGAMRDGPGWRSIIYFKGCNLRCRWCGSPETLSPKSEVMFHADRLKYPARLVAACPARAITTSKRGIAVNRKLCASCATHACASASIDGAAESFGRTVTVEQLVNEVLPYRRAHENYGVTLSGGEAALQWNFFMETLKAFKHHGMHTAVETNGAAARLPESFPWLDLVICDLKLIDPAEHKRWTGQSNRAVLKNIKLAADAEKQLWIRIPIVPGVNDHDGNIENTIEFLAPMRGRLSVELIGYHRLGLYKWKAIGKRYSLGEIVPPEPDRIVELEYKFASAGIIVQRT